MEPDPVIQNLIENREKIQFHSALSFGKIMEFRTTVISIDATSTLDTPLTHTYSSPPRIIGWLTIAGDTRTFSLTDALLVTQDEFGYDLDIFPYSTDSAFGFYTENTSGSTVILTLNYWLYFV